MKLYSKVLAALLSASLAAQLVAPAYAYNVSSNTTSTGSTGGQIVVNNQDGTQQVLTQEDLENGTNLPEGIVIENGTNTPAPTTPSPEVSQAPAQESEAPQESEEPAQESEAPVQESPAPTQEGGETGSDRIDMNLPVVSPSTENGTSGTTTQQSSELAVYWNPGSGYGVDESKMSVVFPQQQSQKNILQQGLSWLSSLVSGVFGGNSNSVQLPAGKDSNSGRTPMDPVKTFEAAMEQAQALAEEQGVSIRDITIYSMNPQEVLEGETLEVSGADVTVQAWEGRNYDSDVLFYVNNGTLTMEGVNLLARDEENEEESAQTLVQVFDGSVVMGASVAVNGGFTLDFRSAESEKLWDEGSTLTDEKVGNPVIELTEDFQPDSNGYSITVLGQSEEGQRQEVVRTSGMTDAQVQSYAGSFALVGEDSQGLSLEVDQQDQSQSATTVDSGAAPASLSLYAVRATGTTVYWNPGDKFNYNGVEYPAGSDTDRDGSTAEYPVKTLSNALRLLNEGDGTIICMQTLSLKEGAEEYLGYDSDSKTFNLHGAFGKSVVLTNWTQGLPIVDIRGDYTLSLQDIELATYSTTSTQRASNLVTVGQGATVTMGAKSSVTGGSYIQVEFTEGKPNPIQVSSIDASATIFCSGITYASHYDGTMLVEATDALVSSGFNNKTEAGEHLLTKFALSTQNTNPGNSGQGEDKPLVWRLVRNKEQGKENSLILETTKTYKTIYIDPTRGDDTYDGLSCLYPVATIGRALTVFEEGVKEVLDLRAAARGNDKTEAEIDELYPLPGCLAACSTIVVNTIEEWDWDQYKATEEETGIEVKPYLTVHEDSLGTDGGKIHEAPSYVIRVDEGGELTLKNIQIFRTLSTPSIGIDGSKWNLINVVNGGTLTLDGTTELYTQAKYGVDGALAYSGVGIMAGQVDPVPFYPFDPRISNVGSATVTLKDTWTGKIYGLSRGVVLAGKDVSMTMGGGTITENKNLWAGAGVSVFQGAEFTMSNGTISNNLAGTGAGVLVGTWHLPTPATAGDSSKFSMVAGTIEGNAIDLRVDGTQGFEGLGGAGIMSYYSVVELGGTDQTGGNVCQIQNNTLARTTRTSWKASNGVGVSIYGQNTWDENALIVHNATITGNKVDEVSTGLTPGNLSISGIGLSLTDVKSAKIERATISNNTIANYLEGDSATTLQGGGLYVATKVAGATFTFQNLTVTGNKIDSSGFSGGSLTHTVRGGGICFGTMPNDASVLLEHSEVSNNEVGTTLSGYWTVNASGGGIYSDVYLRINDVKISQNQAGNASSSTGDGGGIYGSVLWANKMTLEDNEAKHTGGGWCDTMRRPSQTSNAATTYKSVIQDSTITGNKTLSGTSGSGLVGGGGIAFYNTNYKSGYSCTLTETTPGATKISGNTAAGVGGGVYASSSGTLIFDFASQWDNTADVEAGNLYVNPESDASVYLLKGSFQGSESIKAVAGVNTTGSVYVDPTKVSFQGDNGGDVAIILTDPKLVVSLLSLGKDNPISIQIDPEIFAAGSIIVRPANLSSVTVGTLVSDDTQLGGFKIGSADQSYEPTTDVSKDSGGGDASSYITVTGLPLRTQLTAVPEGGLTSLGLVAEGVYLDGVNGKDGNDGLSSQTAVRTWGEAVELLKKYSTTPPTEEQQTTGFQPIIWVCGTVSLSEEAPLTLPQSVVSQTYKDFETKKGRTPEQAVFRRYAAFEENMFETSGIVTLSDVRIDGNSGAIASTNATGINVLVGTHATLNIENGAYLYNSYGSCVYLNWYAILNVNQTHKPGDEEYGVQIGTSTKQMGNNSYGVCVQTGCQVNLNGYAYIGAEEDPATSQYAFGFRGQVQSDAVITMNDNALVRTANGIYYTEAGSVVMNDDARIEVKEQAVKCQTYTNGATLTMNDKSSIGAAYGSTIAKLEVLAKGNFTLTMLGSSSIECPILADVNTGTTSENGIFKLIMGTENGSDSPTIQVKNKGDMPIAGAITAGGGHMYLEMNAHSSVTGTISIWGMLPGDVGTGSQCGLLMRDSATVQAANGDTTAILLARGVRQHNSIGTTFETWDGAQPFSIVVEESATVNGGIHGDFNYSNPLPTQDENVMGAGQQILLQDNAKVTGTIGDEKLDYGISNVVLKGSAKVEVSPNMSAQDRAVKACQVTLKDTASISPPEGESVGSGDNANYGEYVFVYALEGMELDGTAKVSGPILLGQDAKITLMTEVPMSADPFKLHLSGIHVGNVIVQPGGSVEDASTFLSFFTKSAAQGEAKNLELIGSGRNIILNRSWNVYLSSSGDDANDGSSPEKAVRTFARAKELLKSDAGYGPNANGGAGSNIIIPDSVTIKARDFDWSFEEGGTLTNKNGEKWTPVVTRSSTTVYDQPLIIVDYSSTTFQTEQVKFSNITIDAGGSGVQFDLSAEPKSDPSRTANSLIYFYGTTYGSNYKRSLVLGEGTVIRNLDYDMAGKQLVGSATAGGYAVNVYQGELVMDGCIIEDFKVENFSYDSQNQSSADCAASIVRVWGRGASLTFKSGAIRNNNLDVDMFHAGGDYGGVGILVVDGGAKLNISGGDIFGNTLSGNADEIYRMSTNGYGVIQTGVVVFSDNSEQSTGEMSGGTICNNKNELQTSDETSEARFVEGIVSIGSRIGADYGWSGVTFTMSGGSITDNISRRGSAFSVAHGTVVLAGGTIQGNQSVAEVGSAEWQEEYCPIFIGGAISNDPYVREGEQRLVLQGDSCEFNEPIFLPPGRQIMLSGQLRDTNRVYEVYQSDSKLVQGNVVVVPDNDNIADVTPYLQNFHVYAKGLVLERGRVSKEISTQYGSRDEMSCLIQMKAVFVDGNEGTDPQTFDFNSPPYDLGLTPNTPVKTLDAARAVGQAICHKDEYSWVHSEHSDYYVIYAVGPVYNKLFTGRVLNDWVAGGYTKNDSLDSFKFALNGSSYLARYTGWDLYAGNGEYVSADYYYGNLIEIQQGGNAVMQNFTVQGRREVDSVSSNGETLVVVNSGATLTIQEGTNLELNNVSGTRPGPIGSDAGQAIDARGGAIRVAAGAQLVMTGGTIDSSCTAVTGGSIYLEGKQDTLDAAQLTMQNQVKIGGEIYLGGAQNYDAPILVDQSFAPNGSILIGMQNDYDKKKVVQWTNGAPITEEKLEWFTYSNSVSALYETKAVSSSGESGTLDTIALDLRKILYLNPAQGNDKNDGNTPGNAVRTLERIYSMYETAGDDIPGILVFVMSPITVGDGEQLVITNGALEQDGVTKHISVYSKSSWSKDPNISASIVHTDNEMTINCEVYFRRYVETSDQYPPEGYNVDSYLGELFVVKNGGMLQLNGVYLDGQSIGIQTNNPGLSSAGAIAEAPLVRVEAGGLAQFLTGKLESHLVNGQSYEAGSTMLTNNTNNNSKTNVLPGTEGITEGSSAGIEILSSGTGNGWDNEKRGKVVLQGTKLDNLKLATDGNGKAIIGGSDVYQNGELWIGYQTRFGGSVFLEGNGRSGEDAEAKQSRQTSRWISVSAYGTPMETPFRVIVRDSYQNRRMVVYPYSKNNENTIDAKQIANYMLTDETALHYILKNEQLEPDAGENFFGGGENTLWLRVPPAVYIDPVGGNDTQNGEYPETAVRTLSKAIETMGLLSAKVLYVLNPISITEVSYLYPAGYTHNGTSVALPSQNMQLTIQRYVRPDAPGTEDYYQVESYTNGALFEIKSGGSLTLEGNVILDGGALPQSATEFPADQAYADGVTVTAPLVTVEQGGTLDLRSDGEGEDVTRPTLTNNNNTGDGNHVAGGAINNAGNVILDGGVLTDNQGSAGQGKAEGIYQAGNLTIRSYPQGLGDQTVYLAEDCVITVEELIQTMVGESGEKFTIHVDMDNATAGRDVVTYTSGSNVDAESGWYSLGNSVPGSLFLVQAEDSSNTLELQDWQQLNVSVPEEVFLVVYQAGADSAEIGRGDVDSYRYGVPEYTITNNGTRNVRVSVNGFEKIATQDGEGEFNLVASETELDGAGALLYLALTAPSGVTLADNGFAQLSESSLKISNGENIELGTLQPDQSGSFVFTGSANQALLDLWMDAQFPATAEEGKDLAETRKDYMRNEGSATEESSLKNAAAQFKLTYRIELA